MQFKNQNKQLGELVSELIIKTRERKIKHLPFLQKNVLQDNQLITTNHIKKISTIVQMKQSDSHFTPK